LAKLASSYEKDRRVNDAMMLWAEHGVYHLALWTARNARHEEMSLLIERAIAQDVKQCSQPIDRVTVGILRLIAGHPESAELAIRAGIEMGPPQAYMQKTLGLSLCAQGKWDEAKSAFRDALLRLRQDDQTFKLSDADSFEMTAAYFLDLVSQEEYVAFTKDSKELACFPWFYVGQRKEFEGDRETALTAYKRSVELGDDETADVTRRLAKWRLVELEKHAE
jgi:hypothetical protein